MSDPKQPNPAPETREVEPTAIKVAYGPTPPPSTFANYVALNYTGEEIILDFCELMLETAKGDNSVMEVTAFPRQRVILTPAHAYRLMAALGDTLVRGGHAKLSAQQGGRKP